MGNIVVTGAGVGGLCTALLLAKDGHRVTVLERDAAPPPKTVEDVWESWERRGINQFRLPHFFVARFRRVVEEELPEVAEALKQAGALSINPIAEAPPSVTGGPQTGDDQFAVITGRRPVVEAVLARVAEGTPGVTLRRGTAVGGLLANGRLHPGIPHVTGVLTETGEELRADLVVDATGRRSPLPRWLDTVGARPPHEEVEDCGFVYYGRTFRSRNGSLPMALGSYFQEHDSVSTLTLPADNGTWAMAFVTSAADTALRKLRDPDRWTAAFRLYPTVAHWLDGDPFEPEIKVIAKIEDRYRRFVVDGRPVATGVVAVADSWACTNPSLGRGASIGLMHAVALRDLLQAEMEHPEALVARWDEVTEATVTPWYSDTLWLDRHRLAEVDASIGGEPYLPSEQKWELLKALDFGGALDPALLRARVRNAMVISLLDDVLDELGRETVLSVGGGWREAPPMGPSRNELLGAVGS
jgi:2-polyprenyl-6-methoxyphenol hydroxylase-like FAD-dependent oxidoreductase